MEELTTVAGYECPKTTSKLARRVLRDLSRAGVVVFTHDDGLSVLTRLELVKIAGDIGLDVYESPYRLVLMERDRVHEIDGAHCSVIEEEELSKRV